MELATKHRHRSAEAEAEASYRQRVEEHSHEQQQDEQQEQADDRPLKPAPHDEAHGLTWVCEPQEGCFWATAVGKWNYLFDSGGINSLP